MIKSNQTIGEDELRVLFSHIGATWKSISGLGMTDPSFSWSEVKIQTNAGQFQLALEEELIDIAGQPEEYPRLRVSNNETETGRDGHSETYFQERDEIISEIFVIREFLDANREEHPSFSNVADIGVIFQFENSFIAFLRTSHHMDAFNIQRVSARDKIDFPDTVSEWQPDLFRTFKFAREWISVRESHH